MLEFFKRIVPIRSGEGRAFFYCFAINLLLGVTYVVGSATTDALFLKNFGAEHLALMFAIKAGIVMTAFPVYNYFSDRFDSHKIFIGLSFLFTILLFISGAILLSPTPPTFIYPILLIINALFSALIFTHFATYLINFFDTQQSKRLLPAIFSAVIIGTMLGGFTLPTLLRVSGGSSLLIFGWGILLIAMDLLIALNRKHSTLNKAYSEIGEEKGFFQSFKKNFDVIGKSRFVQLTLLAYFFGDLALSGANILSHTIFASSARFPDADSLTAFYGILEGWIATIALILEFFFIPRLIQSLGVGALNFVLPTLVVLGFAGLAFSPPALVFAFAIIARFNVQAISEYLEPTASNLILNALAPEQKRKVFSFYGGFMEPLGPVITGLILTMLGLLFPITQLASLFFVFGVGYLILTYFQNRAYTHELVRLIERQDFDLFKSAALGAKNLDPKIFAKLEAGLTSDDLGQAIVSAELLADLRGEEALPTLVRIFPDAKKELRSALLALFAKIGNAHPEVLRLVVASLHAPEKELNAEALRTLDAIDTQNLCLTEVRCLAEHVDPTIASLAAIYLCDHAAEHVEREHASEKLKQFLTSKDIAQINELLKQLTNLHHPTEKLWETLLTLPTPTHTLAKNLGHALAALTNNCEHLEHLHQHLPQIREFLSSHHVRELRYFALLALERLHALTETELELLLSDRAKLIRQHARAIVTKEKILTPEKLESLFRATRNPYLFDSTARLLAEEAKSGSRAKLVALIEIALIRAGAELSRLVFLQKHYRDQDAVALLTTVCHDRSDAALETALALLEYCNEKELGTTIAKNLRSGNTRLRASALEALEHLPLPGIKNVTRLLDPLTSRLPYAERLTLFIENKKITLPTLSEICATLEASADPWEQSIGTHARAHLAAA